MNILISGYIQTPFLELTSNFLLNVRAIQKNVCWDFLSRLIYYSVLRIDCRISHLLFSSSLVPYYSPDVSLIISFPSRLLITCCLLSCCQPDFLIDSRRRLSFRVSGIKGLSCSSRQIFDSSHCFQR